jgi:Ca2+-binding EF-hand superfamily protein
MIDDIWKNHDKDNSGFLDYKESKEFVKVLTKMSEKDISYPESEFNACFNEFDINCDGTIAKDEMIAFYMKASGLL